MLAALALFASSAVRREVPALTPEPGGPHQIEGEGEENTRARPRNIPCEVVVASYANETEDAVAVHGAHQGCEPWQPLLPRRGACAARVRWTRPLEWALSLDLTGVTTLQRVRARLKTSLIPY